MADIAGGDFGASLAGTAKQTGENALNQFNPQDVAGTQRAGFTGLLGSQMGAGAPLSSQDLYTKYSQAIASNPTVTSLYNTANNIFGVPELSSNAARLRGQVAALPSQQYQLARGFDVSDPQVQNAINVAGRFLNPQSQMATEQAQAAQNLAGQYVQAGLTQNQMNLLPIQQQGQMLSDALARQSSGFNIAAQNELQGLISKMNAGITLSQNEYARANELLQQQTAYQTSLDTARIGQQYKILNPAQSLVNTITGGITNF